MTIICAPYEVILKPGIYQFECCGSKGSTWKVDPLDSKPGLGSLNLLESNGNNKYYFMVTQVRPKTFCP